MKMPVSEMVDRMSIAILKDERTSEDMSVEISEYASWLGEDEYPEISQYIAKMKHINGRIWDLEADIRAGNEDLLGLEEVGRRAIQIRQLNKIRVGYKNEMVELYQQGFRDIKINHGSE